MTQDSEEWLTRRLRPDRTALLAIDFQNDFCAPGGFYDRIGFDLGMGQAAADRTAALLPLARATGMPVIFLRCVYDAPYVADVMVEAFEHKGFPLDICQDGSWGAELFRVAPAAGDLVMDKHRYSAFVNTPLESVLKASRIENLLLTGVATNVCVDSTARDGYMRDYRVTLVSDCCGSYDEALHQASLETIRRAFGVVVDSDEVARVWSRLGYLDTRADVVR